MESWDDDNFEPPSVLPGNPSVNKWEGEDEDEEVKDNWEDDDEEKPEKPEEVKPPEVKKTKKKPLGERIAEKERLQREELERRQELEEEEEEISQEERIRRQKESDLTIALETTFGGEEANLGNLPSSKDEFQEFGEQLSKKLLSLSKSAEYPAFAENLVRNLCATLLSQDIRKIKNTLDNLYLEKQKIEKGDKTKKNKAKGKVKLKMDDGQLSAYVNEYDDYNDFM